MVQLSAHMDKVNYLHLIFGLPSQILEQYLAGIHRLLVQVCSLQTSLLKQQCFLKAVGTSKVYQSH